MKRFIPIGLLAFVLTISSLACGGSSETTSDVIVPALPAVSSTVPADLSTNAAPNAGITATFNKVMDPATINGTTFTLKQGAIPVVGTVTYAGVIALFKPAVDLDFSTTYTATVTTDVKDMEGNALASDYVWSFTTGAAPDITPPTVISTIPADSATGVAENGNITATFSEPMDHLTITTTTFTVAQGATSVAGAVTYLGLVATFNPTVDLEAGKVYTATLTTGVKDLAGNAMVAVTTWSFTIVSANPAAVNLGAAGNFVILSKTGITNVPTSAITGDIGVSPINAAAITGFAPLTMDVSNEFSTTPQIIGKIYAANYFDPLSKLSTSVLDMGTAYTDAAGRLVPDFVELGAGDISGMTLSRGLYKWGTPVLISTDITLNGSATDVWIFQIAGTLTMAPDVTVHLTGGALAKNIFWQVGASASAVTLGTNAHLEGIVLSATTIALGTGATVNGRLFSATNVTLQSNTVTQPTP